MAKNQYDPELVRLRAMRRAEIRRQNMKKAKASKTGTRGGNPRPVSPANCVLWLRKPV